MKVNSWYSALEQKVTVFYTIYLPASSYPIFVFVFVQNNHGCLGVMQSLQYKVLSEAVLRERKREWKQTRENDYSTITYVRSEITQGTHK